MILKCHKLWMVVFALVIVSFSGPVHAQTNLLGPPPLIDALQKDDYERMRAELIKGVSPNLTNFDKVTALMMASKAEKLDMVELLLQFDAIIELQDNLGNTALFYAAGKNAYDVTELLLQAGADPNTPNRQGVTPFLNALARSDLDIVQMLVDAGADLSLQDYTGRNALEWAGDNRQPAVLNLIEREGGY